MRTIREIIQSDYAEYIDSNPTGNRAAPFDTILDKAQRELNVPESIDDEVHPITGISANKEAEIDGNIFTRFRNVLRHEDDREIYRVSGKETFADEIVVKDTSKEEGAPKTRSNKKFLLDNQDPWSKVTKLMKKKQVFEANRRKSR